MEPFNIESALSTSKELTEIAMQNHMIKEGTTPNQSAQNVYAFYKTLYDHFIRED